MPTTYNQQFKDDVLSFWANSPHISAAQVCRDFGISEASLYHWRKKAAESGNLVTRQATAVSPDEHRKLKLRNRELEQENLVLKRAAAYFAKDALPKGSTLSS